MGEDGQLPKGTSKIDRTPIAWQKEIMRLKMQGLADQEIAEHMWKVFKFKVSKSTVNEWLRGRTDLFPQLVFKREAYVNELESQYIEILQTYKKLTEHTWKLLKDVHEQAREGTVKDKSLELPIISEIRTQVQLANQMMGVLPKSGKQMEDIAMASVKAIKEIDRMGLMKKYEEDQKVAERKEKEAYDDGEDIELELPGEGGTVKVLKRVGIDMSSAGR